jgi:hypothetical protein
MEVTMTHTSNAFHKSILIGCFAAVVLAATPQAQTGEPPSGRQHRMAMMDDGHPMMGNSQSMMADMKAGQEKLDDLIAKMNAATGPLKMDQMAAVLTELVAQQKAMHARMMSMMGHESAPRGSAPKEQPQVGSEQHH